MSDKYKYSFVMGIAFCICLLGGVGLIFWGSMLHPKAVLIGTGGAILLAISMVLAFLNREI